MKRRKDLSRPRGSYATYRMKWAVGMGTWYCVVTRANFMVMRYARTGFLIGSKAGTFVTRSSSGQVEQLQNATEDLMLRRSKPGEGRPVPPHAEYSDLLEQMPMFAAWMTDATFEDGEGRQGGWLGVSCRGGSWCALLKDSAEGLSLQIAAPTATMLLTLIEHALADPAAPWRKEEAKEAQKKKGK